MPFHTNVLAHNADFQNFLTLGATGKSKKRDDTSIAMMVGGPGGGEQTLLNLVFTVFEELPVARLNAAATAKAK